MRSTSGSPSGRSRRLSKLADVNPEVLQESVARGLVTGNRLVIGCLARSFLFPLESEGLPLGCKLRLGGFLLSLAAEGRTPE